MHECNQTACNTSSKPRQGNIHFCCCKGSMCNNEYNWIPPTTEATTQGATGSIINFIFSSLFFCTGACDVYPNFKHYIFILCTLAQPPIEATPATLFHVNELSLELPLSIQHPHKLGACVAISLCYAVRRPPCCVLRSPFLLLYFPPFLFCFYFFSFLFFFSLHIEGGLAFSLACIFCGVPLALCYFVFVFLFFCLAPFYLSI